MDEWVSLCYLSRDNAIISVAIAQHVSSVALDCLLPTCRRVAIQVVPLIVEQYLNVVHSEAYRIKKQNEGDDVQPR